MTADVPRVPNLTTDQLGSHSQNEGRTAHGWGGRPRPPPRICVPVRRIAGFCPIFFFLLMLTSTALRESANDSARSQSALHFPADEHRSRPRLCFVRRRTEPRPLSSGTLVPCSPCSLPPDRAAAMRARAVAGGTVRHARAPASPGWAPRPGSSHPRPDTAFRKSWRVPDTARLPAPNFRGACAAASGFHKRTRDRIEETSTRCPTMVSGSTGTAAWLLNISGALRALLVSANRPIPRRGSCRRLWPGTAPGPRHS
jgi:hypothetical protein